MHHYLHKSLLQVCVPSFARLPNSFGCMFVSSLFPLCRKSEYSCCRYFRNTYHPPKYNANNSPSQNFWAVTQYSVDRYRNNAHCNRTLAQSFGTLISSVSYASQLLCIAASFMRNEAKFRSFCRFTAQSFSSNQFRCRAPLRFCFLYISEPR